MKKKYIKPEIKKIKIDFQISLQMQSGINPVAPLTPAEPGSGGAGIGGDSNGSGESGWGRAQQNPYFENINNYDLLQI